MIILILVSTIGGLTTSCKNKTSTEGKQTKKIDSAATFILQKESFNKEVSFPGELLPMERAEIFAKVSGYVNNVKVDIGDAVQKGQVIAVLEAPEMVANYAQINSDLQTARSKYNGSMDAYKRISNAAKVDGTVAAGELEKIKSQMMADSAALGASKAKLNAYGQLKDYLIIKAPFSGIITQRNIDPGTLVGTGNPKPMLILENNRTLRLRLPIPEVYTASNTDSSSIEFSVDAYPGVMYNAKLSRKAGALNLTNRTETWEFIYPNKSNELKSGMYANAKIRFGRSAPSFFVPSSAVVTNLEKRFVIRLKNGKSEWVNVRNGISVETKTEILGDLSEGDTILVRGTDEIKPGTTIYPKF